MKSNWLFGLVALVAVALAPVVAYAQQSTGDIYGTVMDETGGVLPGVSITLSGNLIGTLNQTTGVNGDFHYIRLSPGDYDLQCQLDGFSTFVQKQVVVVTGGAVSLKITLKPTTVAETVTVTAEQPILDTKKTGVGQNVTQEVLANIPTARDPWVIMSMVSGIVVDRVNIAGAEGGQQSQFNSRGDVGGNNAMWNMDGVTITDMSAVGSSPTYYDFDAFEEVQVTTGGNDPSQQTGGMGINFVTKRGGDVPKGSARFITTSTGLQGDNTKDLHTPDHGGAETLDGYGWNPLFRRVQLAKLRDYGIEIGGPIIKEKAWYWGAVGLQDIQVIAVNGAPDNTQLENLSFKVNSQLSQSASATFMIYRGNKVKRGRDAGATRPTETTWNQSGPTPIYKAELSYIVNPNFYINGKYGFVGNGFGFTPLGGNALATRDADAVWHHSYYYLDNNRHGAQVSIDSNYFLSALGGNHEFKFGFQYRYANDIESAWWYGDIVADAATGTAWITRKGQNNCKAKYTSLYAGDTFTKGKLTLNLGVRFDRQNGSLRAHSAPASASYPNLLPAINVAASTTPFTWNDVSPRLGMTYDIVGDGKTIIRASFARYADQLSAGDVNYTDPLSWAQSELDYLWTDLNNDGYAQSNEIDWATGPVGMYYVDPIDPTSARPTTYVDPNLTAPKRLEFIVGGEHEVMNNFSVGANFVYRQANNYTWRVGTDYKNPGAPYTYNDYEAVVYSGTLPDGTAYSMPYYRLKASRAGMVGAGIDWLYTNQQDYKEKYQALEIFATKRLSNKWMLNASFNYQKDRGYWNGTAGIADPTNVHDGEDLVFRSGSSGKANYYIGTPKWQFLLNGMYQLPYQVNVSANLISRDGFPLVYYSARYYVDPGVTEKDLRVETINTRKYPKMMELDVRISKGVSLGDKGNINLDMDVFNIFNKSTPLHLREQLRLSSTGMVTDLMYPRTVRLGLRYSF